MSEPTLSRPHDGDSRRGVIEAVITLGPQRGAGRIATPDGLAYFEPREWRGTRPPKPGQRVVFMHRGNRATRVEPEPGEPAAPEPDA
jgi:hypothetical protein